MRRKGAWWLAPRGRQNAARAASDGGEADAAALLVVVVVAVCVVVVGRGEAAAEKLARRKTADGGGRPGEEGGGEGAGSPGRSLPVAAHPRTLTAAKWRNIFEVRVGAGKEHKGSGGGHAAVRARA
jgi:hypothetical protein